MNPRESEDRLRVVGVEVPPLPPLPWRARLRVRLHVRVQRVRLRLARWIAGGDTSRNRARSEDA